MHKNIKKLAGMCALAAMPLLAHAEIYICKDASGKTLTSDRPIMECQDRKTRVLGKNGMTAREIAPPLTEEQQRQKAAEDEKRKAASAVAEEQKRQDRALLARYSKEADIEVARQRALESVTEQVKREEASIVATDKNLQKARLEAAAQPKGKVPSSLQRKIDDLGQEISDSKKLIAERQDEASQINARFDQAVKRFRELKNGGVAKLETR
ncbi:DUF4124 domain-containing protein [Janthinobacterium sp. 17J80-10]|uniref:DUF4124 domain-containing protein n=1 Tax=Janthinobacterium sp. 17J80-10 TaxID=2497863 RepID=UPI001005886F|nr:DUF4124 domain-containing protein [Janthinobacterium sp. 17J80-10]QAU33191.1 DUF4124 domain-containing protein [Janthinobacterium sp. 17J80-10]